MGDEEIRKLKQQQEQSTTKKNKKITFRRKDDSSDDEDDEDDAKSLPAVRAGGAGGDNKSKAMLRGELLQATTKLTIKDAQLQRQERALDTLSKELVLLRGNSDEKGAIENATGGSVHSQSNHSILSGGDQSDAVESNEKLRREIKKLEQARVKEERENASKLKDKDETITFLMNQLAHLKKRESATRR